MAGIIDVLVYISKKKVVVDVTWDTGIFPKRTTEQHVCALQKLPEGTKYNRIKWHNCASHSFKTTMLVYNEMSRFVPHLCEQTQV